MKIMDDENKYWLGFSAFPGIGPLRFKLLLDYFGSAKKAWEANEKEFIKIGLGEKLTAKFCQFKNNLSIFRYIDTLKKKKISFITLIDPEYPKLLKEIPNPPFLIYYRGDYSNAKIEVQPRMAVVGTRKITGYGEAVTRKITAGLVDAGVTIVSGLAYGVDAMAHKTAIDGGGRTIAVLGCGIDVIYPAENTKLYWQIIEKYGLVISEFPPGHLVAKGLFPSRNRIISGLSMGVVVCEGAQDSGALITARYAAEQGREVFAVPGPITSDLSAGPTILLRQGAKLVTEAKDILEELRIRPIRQISQIGEKAAENLTNDERKILELLQNESLHFDEIVKKSGIAAAKLGSILTLLEMKKIVSNHGGGVYGINIG